MSICEYCQPIFFQRSSVEYGENHERKHPRILRPLRDLFEGQWACQLCQTFKRDLRKPKRAEIDTFQLIFERGIDDGRFGPSSSVDVLEIRAVPRRDHIDTYGYTPTHTYYRMFAECGGPLSPLITATIVERDGTSEATFARIKDLVRSHVDMEEESTLPTRLIDLQGCSAEHVCLCETQAKQGRYAALSHCWGDSKQFTTTVATLHERLTSIEIAQMPKTFQDAVTIARELALPYLWIDSLCIIQQNKEDWEAESSKMGDYYGNATVTLAAANSSADSEGFLRDRSTDTRLGEHDALGTFYVDQCSLFELYVGGKAHRLYLKKIQPEGVYGTIDSDSDPVGPQPLQRRAWTLQERFLSKQILHFGRAQNYLEDNISGMIFYEDGQTAKNAKHWSKLHNDKQALRFEEWYSMVCEFMERDITNRSDTFPALSGLAQRLAEQTNEKYVAGLWESDLTRGLLWRASYAESHHRQASYKYESESYRAPSWSWASCDKPIAFMINDLTNKMDPDSWLNGVDDDPDSIDISLIKSLQAESQPLGPDHFGRLRSASLFLTAPVLEISKFTKQSFPLSQGLQTCIEIPMSDGNTYTARAFLDDVAGDQELPESDAFAVFTCYIMGPSYRAEPNVPFGLQSSLGIIVRKQNGKADTYIRMGVFQGEPQSGFATVWDGGKPDVQTGFGDESTKRITLV